MTSKGFADITVIILTALAAWLVTGSLLKGILISLLTLVFRFAVAIPVLIVASRL